LPAQLKPRYHAYTRVLTTSGLGTGDDAKSSEEVEEVWKTLCSAHPECSEFRYKPFEFYEEVAALMGDKKFTGEHIKRAAQLAESSDSEVEAPERPSDGQKDPKFAERKGEEDVDSEHTVASTRLSPLAAKVLSKGSTAIREASTDRTWKRRQPSKLPNTIKEASDEIRWEFIDSASILASSLKSPDNAEAREEISTKHARAVQRLTKLLAAQPTRPPHEQIRLLRMLEDANFVPLWLNIPDELAVAYLEDRLTLISQQTAVNK